MRSGLGSGAGLAEEIIFFHRGEPSMRITAAYHAKFVRIGTEFFFELEPVLQPERAYSNSSMSVFFSSLRSRLPLSQRSKLANSSLGERNGCASPSPLICVAS